MLSPRARRRTLELLLDQAIRLSFPHYTYPEMRALFRARFHLYFEWCLERGARRETLARLAGLTAQGMRNLGDVRAPLTLGARGERLILEWLERAGPDGLSFDALAERYEAESPPGGAPLEEALWALVTEGRITRLARGRYGLGAGAQPAEEAGLSASAREILLAVLASPTGALTHDALEEALRRKDLKLDPGDLARLERSGEVERRGGLITLTRAPDGAHLAFDQPHEAILETLLGFGACAIDAVRAQEGAGPALASGWCLDLPADPEARWALLAALRDQVAAWTAEAEAAAAATGAPLTTVEVLLTASTPHSSERP